MTKEIREIEKKIQQIQAKRRELYQAGDIAGCDALADQEANLSEDLDIAFNSMQKK
jgi:hypothetical protein